MTDALLGPLAALALALLFIGLFYTGKILPRNVVPREDYEALRNINASFAEGIRVLTKAVEELVTHAQYLQRNGKNGAP